VTHRHRCSDPSPASPLCLYAATVRFSFPLGFRCVTRDKQNLFMPLFFFLFVLPIFCKRENDKLKGMKMSNNIFVLAPSEYKRDINIIDHYKKDSATYLSKMTGLSFEECLEHVEEETKFDTPNGMIDRKMQILVKDENGDMQKGVTTFSKYLDHVIKSGNIITPPLTTWLPPSVIESKFAGFLDEKTSGRGVAKKQMYAAMAAGDKLTEQLKETEQKGLKTTANALSGAQSTAGNITYNPAGHSTLTSNCRNTSGLGNANNEKFISGTRLYFNPYLAINNITSIIRNTDYVLLEKVINQFGLVLPTTEETVRCIKRSTDLYFEAKDIDDYFTLYVSKLTGYERAAFVYTGDLYHIRVLNDRFMRQFLDDLRVFVDEVHPEPKKVIDSYPEAYVIHAKMICSNILRGKDMKNVVGTDDYGRLASTLERLNTNLEHYADFIKCFFVSENIPSSVALFPDSMRRVVIRSDTDSTIFTAQEWVEWYDQELTFSYDACRLSDVIVFLCSQTIVHILARMSANFGIKEKRIHQIGMKNEYKFDVFGSTQLGKHYFSIISSQEGLIFKDFKKEVKGVHLISSSVSKKVIKRAEELMLFILKEIYAGRKIKAIPILHEVADMERSIFNDIKNGGYEYFRRCQIKPAAAYKNGENTSNYKSYLFWNEVFGAKYGYAPEPPYSAIQVNVDLDKPMLVMEWIASMKDPVIAENIKKYLIKNGRKNLGSNIIVPSEIAMTGGIPLEVLDASDYRSTIKKTTNVFYIILETLGFYLADSKNTRLIMDNY